MKKFEKLNSEAGGVVSSTPHPVHALKICVAKVNKHSISVGVLLGDGSETLCKVGFSSQTAKLRG